MILFRIQSCVISIAIALCCAYDLITPQLLYRRCYCNGSYYILYIYESVMDKKYVLFRQKLSKTLTKDIEIIISQIKAVCKRCAMFKIFGLPKARFKYHLKIYEIWYLKSRQLRKCIISRKATLKQFFRVREVFNKFKFYFYLFFSLLILSN